MATKGFIALLCILLILVAIPIRAQHIGTTTTSTTGIPVSQLDSLIRRHVGEIPEFCFDLESAKKHCAVAPVLFKAGQTWENRANEQLNEVTRLKLDVESCETRCMGATKPTPPVELEASVGISAQWILIGAGAIAAAVLTGIGIGFVVDDD